MNLVKILAFHLLVGPILSVVHKMNEQCVFACQECLVLHQIAVLNAIFTRTVPQIALVFNKGVKILVWVHVGSMHYAMFITTNQFVLALTVMKEIRTQVAMFDKVSRFQNCSFFFFPFVFMFFFYVSCILCYD